MSEPKTRFFVYLVSGGRHIARICASLEEAKNWLHYVDFKQTSPTDWDGGYWRICAETT